MLRDISNSLRHLSSRRAYTFSEVAIPELKALAQHHAETMDNSEMHYLWSGEGYTKKRGANTLDGSLWYIRLRLPQPLCILSHHHHPPIIMSLSRTSPPFPLFVPSPFMFPSFTLPPLSLALVMRPLPLLPPLNRPPFCDPFYTRLNMKL